jgi:hypothetical protein
MVNHQQLLENTVDNVVVVFSQGLSDELDETSDCQAIVVSYIVGSFGRSVECTV